ncbi:MAG: DUF4363 family protein [Bacteroides sp.]|nr:DUF4363 family protein [Bacteroides sp.]
MKRIIVCCVLTALIFAGGITGVIYTARVGDSITACLKQARESYLSGDKERAVGAAAEASDIWSRFRELHILIMDNGHALEITMSAERIKRLMEADDDEAIVECGVMEELVKVYCKEQEIRWGNVF